jgi:hypothetical protein
MSKTNQNPDIIETEPAKPGCPPLGLLSRLSALENELRIQASQVLSPRKMHDRFLAQADAIREAQDAIWKLTGYAATVRTDRRKSVDGDVMCMQTLEWCEELIAIARKYQTT